MKYFLLLFFFLLAGLEAGAQPAGKQSTALSQSTAEQRRAELRMALKDPYGREAPERAQMVDERPIDRRLSAQERENLRQQLRSQRRDARAE